MPEKIIGRENEQRLLTRAFASQEAELIAVYGRRRVGKTFLMREFFAKKTCVFFYVTGIWRANLSIHLEKFKEEVERVFYAEMKGTRLSTPKTWMEAFGMLTDAIKQFGKNKKIVLFFDELPWMATKKSRLLQAIDYYWNRLWSQQTKLKIILCGSAASWMIDNLINSKGGLHNRVTCRVRLEPFSLKDTENYLKSRHIVLNRFQLLQLYMCIGGIPYYLKFVTKGLSAIQNINKILFQKNGALLDEFKVLFSSLFDHAEAHEELIKLIASYRNGIDRTDIEKRVTLSYKGRSLTKRLQELECSGFITSFVPQGRKKGKYYKLIDEYTLFYLTWIAPETQSRISKEVDEKYWEKIAQTPGWRAWAGYAFEEICYKHIQNIQRALNIPSGSTATAWKYSADKLSNQAGAQIDLLFDRDDGAVTLCEIKYCQIPYEIDKAYASNLINKIKTYKKVTKTEKQIFLAMITSCRLKKNIYAEEMIGSEVVLDDLFYP